MLISRTHTHTHEGGMKAGVQCLCEGDRTSVSVAP